MAEWSVEHWGVLGTWFSGMATTAIRSILRPCAFAYIHLKKLGSFISEMS